jgi:hypothetical protein
LTGIISLVSDNIPDAEIPAFIEVVEKLLDAYYEELDRDTPVEAET